MPTLSKTDFTDAEFGTITVRRIKGGRFVRIRIGANGKVSASLPMRAPLMLVKELLEKSRPDLRKSLDQKANRKSILVHGSRIGSAHSLSVITAPKVVVKLRSPHVVLAAPASTDVESSEVQKMLTPFVEKALRIEAKAFLPRRLRYLAEQYGFSYKKIRYSSAGTRWGSCSSQGTISLNIWLMQLSPELIDYVLIHELCHTRHMDHSSTFWSLVESLLPDYKQRRKILKTFQPQM